MKTETEVKERPILFSGEMVRAILEGRKTQTRRIVKPQPRVVHDIRPDASILTNRIFRVGDQRIRCPYGSPGDLLWVRETWSQPGGLLRYRADGDRGNWDAWKWIPSIHMPRWASRITLEILNVRVERLWDISPDDCRAEGLPADNTDIGVRYGFGILWESIYGPGSWDINPLVWVIEFERVQP